MSGTRVLYISGSIGLGHAARDLAIARELRRLNPSAEVMWLAGEPARQLIREAGENVLPESAGIAETGVAEQTAGEFSLNVTKAVQRQQDAWKRTVSAFWRVTANYGYDLLVGDEAYEVMGALRRHPERRTAPVTMIYDCVGLDAMTRSPAERLMVYAYNRIWAGGYRRRPPGQDLVLFVGEPDDVADRPFGFLLANRRQYARRYYHFLGYVLPFDPATYADRQAVRTALGYDDRPLIVCAVGGITVGAGLLRLCAAAHLHIQRRVPGARMVLVCGPRLDPSTLPAADGVEVRGYVPRLYEHLAASDAAIVQAGGATTLELTALRRPFIYFPLEGHFEQNLVVAKRLARHHAGQPLVYSQTTPQALANTVVALLGSQPHWPPIRTDGARRAAELINTLAPATAPSHA